jgi:hypothetical protein
MGNADVDEAGRTESALSVTDFKLYRGVSY